MVGWLVAWLLASAAVCLKSSLLWNVTQGRSVVFQAVQREFFLDCFSFEDGKDILSGNVGNKSQINATKSSYVICVSRRTAILVAYSSDLCSVCIDGG